MLIMGFFKKEKKEVVDVQPFSTPYESKTNESCDGLTRAMDNAADVATMRHVLLQFFNWFKSDFKELPLLQADPFVDDWCNGMTGMIYDYMSDITKKKEETNKTKV
jgi:hypothetical protein